MGKDVRERDQFKGIVWSKPGVQGGAPVLAGTRMTTSTIWAYHADGADVEQILEQYPHLDEEDVETALRFERRTRKEHAREMKRALLGKK